MSQELRDTVDRFIDLQLFAEGDPPANPPAGGDGGNPPNPPVGRTFSEEYVQSLRTESAGYRTQLRAYEKALKEYLGLKPDDDIKDVSQALMAHKTAQLAALEKATKDAKALLVKAEVKVLANELGIVDPDAAMALADFSKVQVTEDGKVEGVKEALEALLQAKPWLKKQSSGPIGSGTNPPGAGRDDKKPANLFEAVDQHYRKK